MSAPKIPCLKRSYLFEIEHHPVGCVEANGLVHSLADFVLQDNVRGKFGAAHVFGPVFNGTAKEASKSAFSIFGLYVKSLEKSYRRTVGAIHIVSTQGRLGESNDRFVDLACEIAGGTRTFQ